MMHPADELTHFSTHSLPHLEEARVYTSRRGSRRQKLYAITAAVAVSIVILGLSLGLTVGNNRDGAATAANIPNMTSADPEEKNSSNVTISQTSTQEASSAPTITPGSANLIGNPAAPNPGISGSPKLDEAPSMSLLPSSSPTTYFPSMSLLPSSSPTLSFPSMSLLPSSTPTQLFPSTSLLPSSTPSAIPLPSSSPTVSTAPSAKCFDCVVKPSLVGGTTPHPTITMPSMLPSATNPPPVPIIADAPAPASHTPSVAIIP